MTNINDFLLQNVKEIGILNMILDYKSQMEIADKRKNVMIDIESLKIITYYGDINSNLFGEVCGIKVSITSNNNFIFCIKLCEFCYGYLKTNLPSMYFNIFCHCNRVTQHLYNDYYSSSDYYGDGYDDSSSEEDI